MEALFVPVDTRERKQQRKEIGKGGVGKGTRVVASKVKKNKNKKREKVRER